jgi:hypothetical protein
VSQRQSFDIAGVPTLDLAQGRAAVDIGYLGGQEHRDAFVDIFAKMLKDSEALFGDCRLEKVESKRAVRQGPALPIQGRDLIADPASFARGIYDSGNEMLVLLFVNGSGKLRVAVRFHNPEFWRD